MSRAWRKERDREEDKEFVRDGEDDIKNIPAENCISALKDRMYQKY